MKSEIFHNPMKDVFHWGTHEGDELNCPRKYVFTKLRSDKSGAVIKHMPDGSEVIFVPVSKSIVPTPLVGVWAQKIPGYGRYPKVYSILINEVLQKNVLAMVSIEHGVREIHLVTPDSILGWHISTTYRRHIDTTAEDFMFYLLTSYIAIEKI